MASTPDLGVPAPDFTLPGIVLSGTEVERRDFTLSAHRGKPIVLAFYPGDDTPVCTKQMCAYNNELEKFADIGAEVWGISPQDLDSHEKFAQRHGLQQPLLADPAKTVIQQYGVGLKALGLKRSVFLVDAEGVLRWKHVATLGLKFQSVDTLTAQIAALA
ncbi:alkyl hydroperoxide reductase/ Thiol specific antioxidant/ Mal allergen [Catenulispora acidiphila DSM 44928]|uniref:thioredoxin-dependent peroxiredoxin n=1 Tax=Catenulispora acidiphila (strain DSM 44928 / JCM 14897 / NBRC 102108 / NRRL B-24433 / ID139908) TaxID=479433 RepID=C7Q5F8_CATAD|nr:peroxiredoxin [Catenulispora acidiphila]ACU75927.1 alkyl hydroperoxide reductase/ Thiol specific antioxidant/ Mal allergen [Catenulispora acidiphila DSM 44928]